MLEFEVIRRSASPEISLKMPVDAVRGLAIMRDTSDSAVDRPQGQAANGACIGFLKRDVVTGGPTTLERAEVFPGRAENPDTTGGQVTLDAPYDAFEAEGTTYLITSGTGALTTGTALNTNISFKNGKAYQAQSGDVAQYKLSAIMPTVVNAGALRCLFERI